MDIQQSLEFRKAYKKLHDRIKTAVDDEIRKIIVNPEIGVEKSRICAACMFTSSKYKIGNTYWPIRLTRKP